MFYQGLKAMKAAVIGTIMPWSGPLSEVPDGWIICDGTQQDGKDYPLLVQVIGDTYNSGGQSADPLGGSFPNYTGKFTLPNLLDGKALMDLEPEYFAAFPAGTGKSIDLDSDARNLIEPYIGENRDASVPQVFTDVYTDVEFELTDRNSYQGVISGNSIIDGQAERVIFVGGRKLGHSHIPSHVHTGSYETLNNNPFNQPGRGVIPWDNVEMRFKSMIVDIESDGEQDDPTTYDAVWGAYMLQYEAAPGQIITLRNNDGEGYATIESAQGTGGFGGGTSGRVVASVNTEQPPVNITPFNVSRTPIVSQDAWNVGPDNSVPGRIESEATVLYGSQEGTFQIPSGFQNYYSDYDPADLSPSPPYYGTLLSNSGQDWQQTGSTGTIFAHSHDPFTVIYDQGSLKPVSRLYPTVNIPQTTTLDNASNKGAFQIDMNTQQPSLTCLYIIRAY